jgi:hypothetical protein
MSLLDKLEKQYGHWAIPNVMLGLIVVQLLVYALILAGVLSFGAMPLIPSRVLGEGELWRLITFIVSPPKIAGGAISGLFLAIFWYILWMMSQALEAAWGAFRFNLYLLVGILFTVISSLVGQLISPSAPIVIFPDFLYLSIFWAFALHYPNMEFYLFFVLPVKVKWLAMLTGVFTGFNDINGRHHGCSIGGGGAGFELHSLLQGGNDGDPCAREKTKGGARD